MIDKKLKGIIPPMITPLLGKDELDVEGLKRLVEHMLAGGVHGLFVLGTTGEAPSLSYHLRYELVERVCKQVAGRVPVLVGVTDTSFTESIRLAEQSKAYGADAVVSAPPYYYAPSQQELIEYYEDMADHMPLPLFLYNMPSHVKVSFEPETVRRIAHHPNVIGLKDSSGNMIYFHTLIQMMKTEHPDFSLLIGPEELTAEAVLAGADGGVNGGANLFPRLYTDLYEAAVRRDMDTVLTLQQQVMFISNTIYKIGRYGSSYLKGLKCACSLMGICSDFMASPYHRFRKEERLKVQQVLEHLNVKIVNP
ncbi:MAG: dihydrodipicolinate synthase family protein [Bacteroidota bacterium]|nr:dihydrodipicolinate synthase family protein [Bacteroidota bacterium]